MILVPSKMEEAHLILSLPLNAAIKSGQYIWSNYLKTWKRIQELEEKHQNSKWNDWSWLYHFFPPVATDWTESSPKPSRGHTGKEQEIHLLIFRENRELHQVVSPFSHTLSNRQSPYNSWINHDDGSRSAFKCLKWRGKGDSFLSDWSICGPKTVGATPNLYIFSLFALLLLG